MGIEEGDFTRGTNRRRSLTFENNFRRISVDCNGNRGDEPVKSSSIAESTLEVFSVSELI
jgi:hypothetical protein